MEATPGRKDSAGYRTLARISSGIDFRPSSRAPRKQKRGAAPGSAAPLSFQPEPCRGSEIQAGALIPAIVASALPDLTGKRVMLVDDLLSTGSTLRSAKVLLDTAGVAGVFGVCLLSSTGGVRTDVARVLTDALARPTLEA
ncbi:phosphoribosyltransferase domain-containing protein [Skermanella rosea]|uniref:Phosphoribosyltransferase domain-containing protein n=1 Tax=Skermanella cutis TaxID=2775420 RepID=A0ABX7B5M3_9PROT|nr:hypothetical protein IGS68_26465 [Skermanella sp. TT6]UEM03618.1 phosphoribosyltransferase domain-containing protein [Skermanella rosea]